MKLRNLTLAATAVTLAFSAAAVQAKTDVKIGGFVKVDGMFTNFEHGQGHPLTRSFYIPSVTAVAGGEEDSKFDAHARQTRFRFASSTDTAEGDKVNTLVELDFETAMQGDERISNSYNPRLRHALVSYKGWTVGQTWSTFQDVRALPESVDFIGVTDGTIFARQTLVRYKAGNFEISAENPESTVTPFGGGGRIVADDNAMPDIAARYTINDDWGHFAIAGLMRQLSYNDGNDIDDSTASYGVSLTGKVKVGAQNDVRFMLNTGSGLGRYLALNASNGAVLNENGELEAIDSTGIALAYRHVWTAKSRTNFTYSNFRADNPIELTGTGATAETTRIAANYMYSPTKSMTVGAEVSMAERETEAGQTGEFTRLHLTMKYAF